jgi:hypothetical protein
MSYTGIPIVDNGGRYTYIFLQSVEAKERWVTGTLATGKQLIVLSPKIERVEQ